MIQHNNLLLDLCSARVWTIHGARNGYDKPGVSIGPDLDGFVLFGHNARVWDCCISDFVRFTNSLFLFSDNLLVKKHIILE